MQPVRHKSHAQDISAIARRWGGLQNTALFVITGIGSVWLLGHAQSVLMPVIAAVVLGLLFGPLQARLERAGFPAFFGAIIILSGLLSISLVSARVLYIPLSQLSQQLPDISMAIEELVETGRAQILLLNDATELGETATSIDHGISNLGQALAEALPGVLGGVAASIPSAAAQFILLLGAFFFFLATRTTLRAQLLSLCMDRRAKLRTARIIADAEQSVSTYLGTVALINIGIAMVSGLAFMLAGVSNPWLWGALAGLFNFIPYIGPGILTVLLLGVGLIEDGTFIEIILPALLFFCINMLEANFVTPSILGQRLTVQPLLVVLSLAFWLWLWGIVGALLAVPIL